MLKVSREQEVGLSGVHWLSGVHPSVPSYAFVSANTYIHMYTCMYALTCICSYVCHARIRLYPLYIHMYVDTCFSYVPYTYACCPFHLDNQRPLTMHGTLTRLCLYMCSIKRCISLLVHRFDPIIYSFYQLRSSFFLFVLFS